MTDQRYENMTTHTPSQEELDFLEEMEAVAAHGETKQEAFLRLVNKRLPAAVKRIRLLANLTNTGNYEFTEEQADAVLAVLNAEYVKLENAFKGGASDDNVPPIT